MLSILLLFALYIVLSQLIHLGLLLCVCIFFQLKHINFCCGLYVVTNETHVDECGFKCKRETIKNIMYGVPNLPHIACQAKITTCVATLCQPYLYDKNIYFK
jgi:hypothetical protein